MMEYVGEWIGLAYAGRALVATGFASALLATAFFSREMSPRDARPFSFTS